MNAAGRADFFLASNASPLACVYELPLPSAYAYLMIYHAPQMATFQAGRICCLER